MSAFETRFIQAWKPASWCIPENLEKSRLSQQVGMVHSRYLRPSTGHSCRTRITNNRAVVVAADPNRARNQGCFSKTKSLCIFSPACQADDSSIPKAELSIHSQHSGRQRPLPPRNHEQKYAAFVIRSASQCHR